MADGKSAQQAFNAAMDAGAAIPAFEAYKTTAKNDLNEKTAALNAALDEVDSKEAILEIQMLLTQKITLIVNLILQKKIKAKQNKML